MLVPGASVHLLMMPTSNFMWAQNNGRVPSKLDLHFPHRKMHLILSRCEGTDGGIAFQLSSWQTIIAIIASTPACHLMPLPALLNLSQKLEVTFDLKAHGMWLFSCPDQCNQ